MNEDKDIAPSNQIKKINEINTDGLKWTLSLLSGGRTWYLKTKKDIVAILHGRNMIVRLNQHITFYLFPSLNLFCNIILVRTYI